MEYGIVIGNIVKIITNIPNVTYHLFNLKKWDKSLAICSESDLKTPRITAITFNQQYVTRMILNKLLFISIILTDILF